MCRSKGHRSYASTGWVMATSVEATHPQPEHFCIFLPCVCTTAPRSHPTLLLLFSPSLCILRLRDPSLPCSPSLSLSPYLSSLHPPPALHQPTPAIFTPHTSVAALIQPQMAAGSIDKWIIQQQRTSPSLFPSLLLFPRTPPAIGPWRRRGPYWAGPRLSTSQALYWGVYGALCCQRSALPSPSSIILGSRAAITGQTGGQSQLSRKLYRRWRKKQRGENKRIFLFLLLPVWCLIWLASCVPSGCMTKLVLTNTGLCGIRLAHQVRFRVITTHMSVLNNN